MANSTAKFLRNISGVISEVFFLLSTTGTSDANKPVATDTTGHLDGSLMPNGAPIDTSAGASSAGLIVKTNSSGQIDVTMMPTGTDIKSLSMPTSENLSSGNFVNVYFNVGTLTARKADATAVGKKAHGFVLAASTSPAANIVYFEGMCSGQSALTLGTDYFLSATTPGTPTATAPSSSGNIVQSLGTAMSATTIASYPGMPITLA
ncbi:MAG: hypothetical protein WC378_00895 [Opitutaceae bacterium]|jgi:hypothetical protein